MLKKTLQAAVKANFLTSDKTLTSFWNPSEFESVSSRQNRQPQQDYEEHQVLEILTA